MLAVVTRISRDVDVPLTVDAEAGYGMEPAELVAALRSAGAAGCNLEDTDHAAGALRDPDEHAEWLSAVRQVASEDGYGLVINVRIDVFLGPFLAGALPGTQVRRFVSETRGPVDVVRLPQAPPLGELAALGVARVSWGHLLYHDAMARLGDQLASLQP